MLGWCSQALTAAPDWPRLASAPASGTTTHDAERASGAWPQACDQARFNRALLSDAPTLLARVLDGGWSLNIHLTPTGLRPCEWSRPILRWKAESWGRGKFAELLLTGAHGRCVCWCIVGEKKRADPSLLGLYVVRVARSLKLLSDLHLLIFIWSIS